MQPAQHTISLALKAAYFGAGGLALFILEVLALVYGLSDGSFVFVAPLLISPFLGIIGIVMGIIALKRDIPPRGLALLGAVCGGICVLLVIGILGYAMLWVAAWNTSTV